MNEDLMIRNVLPLPQSSSRREAAECCGGRLFPSRFESIPQVVAGHRRSSRPAFLGSRQISTRLAVVHLVEIQRGLRNRMTWDWEGSLQKPKPRKAKGRAA